MSGEGFQYVNSKITRPDILSEELFFKWYFEEHVPEVISHTGVNTAVRYQDIEKNAERPYLVIYPTNDIAHFRSPGSRGVRVTSDLLPGTGEVFNVADFDIRYYTIVQIFEPSGTRPGENIHSNLRLRTGYEHLYQGRAPYLMSVGIEPADGTTDEEFDQWYRKEHLGMVSKCSGYRRTTRYKLSSSRQNLRPEAERTIPIPPRWLALHEFDDTNVPVEQLSKTTETLWSKVILGAAKRIDAHTYKLINTYTST